MVAYHLFHRSIHILQDFKQMYGDQVANNFLMKWEGTFPLHLEVHSMYSPTQLCGTFSLNLKKQKSLRNMHPGTVSLHRFTYCRLSTQGKVENAVEMTMSVTSSPGNQSEQMWKNMQRKANSAENSHTSWPLEAM
ncbi:uncharacterized protein [Apostichopus japonicus]|uniref:uncharacterized protein isoform X1 n=1 Tax=Stichopus japonicus TaxID=307972 RepID=UPI003AB49F82